MDKGEREVGWKEREDEEEEREGERGGEMGKERKTSKQWTDFWKIAETKSDTYFVNAES